MPELFIKTARIRNLRTGIGLKTPNFKESAL